MDKLEFKPFSEWVKGWGSSPMAGDYYDALPETSKQIIDKAIDRYIEYRLEKAKKHLLKELEK